MAIQRNLLIFTPLAHDKLLILLSTREVNLLITDILGVCGQIQGQLDTSPGL